MITGEGIQRAEVSLVQAMRIVPEDRILFDRAFTEREGLERFLRHHMSILTVKYPALDPTLEPALLTMFRHMFLVGAVAGREDASRE